MDVMKIEPIDAITINDYVDGNLIGDNINSTKVKAFDDIEDYSISFCKYTNIEPSKNCVSTIIVPLDYNISLRGSNTLILVKNPKLSFAKLLKKIKGDKNKPIISNNAAISNKSCVGDNVAIGDFSYIGDDVTIGDNTIVSHGCIIENGVNIGSDCYIGPNTCIGVEGFGFIRNKEEITAVPHIGRVIIENNVHIGSLCSISIGVINDTIIKRNSKISHNVNIAHNVIIGVNCIITGKVQISGSVVIGDNTWVGPNSSLIQKISIGEGCTIGIGSTVVSDMCENSTTMSLPSVDLEELLNLKKIIYKTNSKK